MRKTLNKLYFFAGNTGNAGNTIKNNSLLMTKGFTQSTSIFFSQSLTCSLTQPLKTAVIVGGQLYSSLCTLSSVYMGGANPMVFVVAVDQWYLPAWPTVTEGLVTSSHLAPPSSSTLSQDRSKIVSSKVTTGPFQNSQQ